MPTETGGDAHEAGGPRLAVVADASRAIFEAQQLINLELARLMQEQLQAGVEASQELIGCRSFEEVIYIQTRYLRSAQEQIFARMTELESLLGSLAESSLELMRSQAGASGSAAGLRHAATEEYRRRPSPLDLSSRPAVPRRKVGREFDAD